MRCTGATATGSALGGGVLLLTRRGLAARARARPPASAALYDLLHVTVPARSIKSLSDMHIICFYMNGTRTYNDPRLEHLTNYLNDTLSQFPDDTVVLLGDLNMSSVHWLMDLDKEYMLPSGHYEGSILSFLNLMSDCALRQYNSIANGNGNFLELIFSNTYTYFCGNHEITFGERGPSSSSCFVFKFA